jgi:hypothetical protein
MIGGRGGFVLTALMSDSYTNVVSLSQERYIDESVLSTSSDLFAGSAPSRNSICVFETFLWALGILSSTF